MYSTAFWCLFVAKTQWNTLQLQVSLFYSIHLRKSKVQRYLTRINLSNIFLIQSLLYSTVAFNATPARRLCYVNYITPFPRDVSLGGLCSHTFSLTASAKMPLFVSPCPLEYYLQSETKIEPDLRLGNQRCFNTRLELNSPPSRGGRGAGVSID